MIGCLLTGHGSFAPGLSGALEMIAGPQQNFEVVPFKEEDGLDTFSERMTAAINKLLEENDGLVIFCDLLGGTPFNVAMTASQSLEHVEVIAGTNLPLLIECAGMRFTDMSLEDIVSHIVEIGKTGVSRVELQVKEDQIDEEEEGI